MKKRMTLLLAGMMLLGVVTVAGATTTIKYISNATFTNFGESYTVSAKATVGQMFRLSVENIGADNFLDSVTLWITPSQGIIAFKFYLYQWDGANSRITGDPLFESGQMSTTQPGAREKFTVDLGGIELDVDKDYVFFVSASDFFDGSESRGSIDAVLYLDIPGFPEDPSPDHKLVYNDNGADFSLLSSTEWSKHPTADMAFEMVLSAAVPEPGPEPSATFELTKAKVDLKKGRIKLTGEMILPEGVTYDDLAPEGSVKVRFFERNNLVEAVDDSVELEVKGRSGEKWQYKNGHTFGVTEYKVHWKDAQTGKVKIKADFDPDRVDVSQLTPKLVAEITLGDLGFELTIAAGGEYDSKLKGKKWEFRNKP